MLLRLAWKNIWRKKIRSLVVLIAIIIGIWAGVMLWAIYGGIVEQRVNLDIETESSFLQIHNKGFIEDPELKNTIDNKDSIIKQILSIPEVIAVAPRTIVYSMIMSSETGAGIKLIGVIPDEESKVTNINSKIIEGKYFGDGIRNPIIIGNKLAEKLKVKLKSKVVITLQDINGTITRAQFRVAGIYRTSNSAFDEMNVFLTVDDLNSLINLNSDQCHEIAIKLNNNSYLDNVKLKLQKLLPDKDIKTWLELMPEVSLVVKTMDITAIIFLGIMLFALIFVIINTMLMAVLERKKELGMLMAIGMSKKRIFRMIFYETTVLTITGGIIGSIISVLLSIILGKTGIDLSIWSEAFESIGYDAVIYPILEIRMLIITIVMVIITGIIASLYPATKALKVNPVEALHIDL